MVDTPGSCSFEQLDIEWASIDKAPLREDEKESTRLGSRADLPRRRSGAGSARASTPSCTATSAG